MKFQLVTLLFAGIAVALPNGGGGGKPTETPTPEPPAENPPTENPPTEYAPCTSTLFSNPQCCSTDVLGAIGLDCANPSKAPSSKESFVADCATVGQQALCCVLPVADQDVLCQPPV